MIKKAIAPGSLSYGFALVEILIVLAILSILLGLILAGVYFSQISSHELDSGVQEIIAVLRLAQNKTLASEGAGSFGVHFAANQFIFFKGTPFDPAAADNEVHNLASSLRLTDINFSGSDNVVFERLTGAVQNPGSVKIARANDANQNKVIFVDYSGVISLTNNSASDSERISDSRHTHVLYSQNTKSASTLTLYFPANSLTQNINYQDYLNSDKTEFSWSGTINVGGTNQTLKIHTHGLSDTSALFCSHRDRRENSKAINISLDGQNLINYAADGVVSPGSSPWADTPQLQ